MSFHLLVVNLLVCVMSLLFGYHEFIQHGECVCYCYIIIIIIRIIWIWLWLLIFYVIIIVTISVFLICFGTILKWLSFFLKSSMKLFDQKVISISFTEKSDICTQVSSTDHIDHNDESYRTKLTYSISLTWVYQHDHCVNIFIRNNPSNSHNRWIYTHTSVTWGLNAIRTDNRCIMICSYWVNYHSVLQNISNVV